MSAQKAGVDELVDIGILKKNIRQERGVAPQGDTSFLVAAVVGSSLGDSGAKFFLSKKELVLRSVMIFFFVKN
jgi:hypothetical protein